MEKEQDPKLRFEKNVRRYYYQLTVGCQYAACTHKLCASCQTSPKLAPQSAAVMSVQLASRPRHFFCPRIPSNPIIDLSDLELQNSSSRKSTPSSSPNGSPKVPIRGMGQFHGLDVQGSSSPPVRDAVEDTPNTTSKPFLHSLLSSSTFASIFNPQTDSSHAHKRSATNLPVSMSRSFSALPTTTNRERAATETLEPPPMARLSSSVPSDSQPKSRSFLDLPSLVSSTWISLFAKDETPQPVSAAASSEAIGKRDSAKGKKPLSDSKDTISTTTQTNNRIVSASLAKTILQQTDTEQLPSVLEFVRSTFSSSDILNRSFHTHPTVLKTSSLGLDIEGIRDTYKYILEASPSDAFKHTLENALEVLLASQLLNLKFLQHGGPPVLRQLVILMEAPLLEISEGRETLLKNLCMVVGSLKSKAKQTLITWLSSYQAPERSGISGIFQAYISSHYLSGVKPDEYMIAAVRSLSLLYSSNELATGPKKAPISTFYNDVLNRKLNFKDEYRQWKATLEASKIVDFSYFNYPFLFDPVSKSRVMHIDAMVQMSQEFEEAVVHQAIVMHAQRFLQDSPSIANLEQELKGATNPFLVLEVRRQFLIKDVLDQIKRKDRDLKKPLRIKFVGGGEEGMDQGGVQKEFFQVIINMLVDPAYGMFTYDDETRYCWFNGASLESEKHFELVGTVLGLALYNGVILGITFPQLIYKKLLGEVVELEDLKQAFPSLGKGLKQLLAWSDGDVADIYCRNFEISYEVYGQVKTFPLVNNGENIPVTNENRGEYVQLYVDHYVNKAVHRQFSAFKRGFYRVCSGKALQMCRAEELELLLCGTANLDFTDLERGAGYDDGYNAEHSLIKSFWSIVHKMSYDRKKKLLMFVTASDRVPLKGLGNLTFVIQRNGPDTDRLPTALTCFGRLLLPEYSSAEKLESRLITAIENAKGFGLV